MLNPRRNSFRDYMELIGFYRFRIDQDGIGEKQEWYKGLESFREVAVPASWNEQHQDLDDYIGTCWYEKEEFIPHDWEGKNIFLRIGAASYHSKVWINGKFAGEHEGGSLPFEFDITDSVLTGRINKVVLSVNAEPDPDRMPPGDFPRDEWVSPWQGQYPSNNYDFYPYGGIHRPVCFYYVPRLYISNLCLKTYLNEGLGKVNFTIDININAKANIAVYINGISRGIFAIKDEKRLSGSLVVEDPVLWDIDEPYLYDFKAELITGGQVSDEYTLTFGIRTVEVSGQQLLLNGKPIFLKGFGKHEDFAVIGKGLNHALIVKDYSLMKWIGANSFRTSHYPYSEEMLDYADRNGFLVIDETPLVGLMKRNYNNSNLVKCKNILQELIDRDKNHPSVIIWSVANEPTSNEIESDQFFKALYEHAKALDDTRPVTMVTCMDLDSDVAIKHFDIICLNRYYGWYSEPGQLEMACSLLERELGKVKMKYNKPVIITEFGADAIPGMHYDPPRQFTEEYQSEMLTSQYKVIRSMDHIAGAHVWAFADFKTSQIYMRVLLNHKGIFTRERQPKLAARELKKLWNENDS